MGNSSSSAEDPQYCDNFARYVVDELRKYGDRVALIDSKTETSYTYDEIILKVMRLAGALQNAHIKPKEVISLVGPNCIEYPVVYLAVTWIGAIFQPLNPLYTAEDLKRTFEETGTRLTFTTESLMGKVREAAPAMHIIALQDIPGQVTYPRLTENTQASLDVDPDVLTTHESVLFCTSGTTGYPKAAEHSHHSALTACVNTTKAYLDSDGNQVFSPGDTVISFIPMCHVFGLHCVTMASLLMGLRVVVMERFNQQLFLSLIRDYKAVLTHVVPPVAMLLANLPNDKKKDLASLRMVVCGAAPLNASIQKKLIDTLTEATEMIDQEEPDNGKASQRDKKKLKPFVMQGFGMSELTVSHCYKISDHEDGPALGSCGRPLPGVKAKIVDVESGCEVENATDKGELYIQTDHMMLGYHGNPAATEEVLDNEKWLRTGDYGYIDDGYLYIVDRLKDVIKYKGHQVPPGLLEDHLMKHPSVADAAVIGVPVEGIGELPRAYIVLKQEYSQPEHRPEEREIVEYIDEKVSPYMKLRGGVEFVKEIPRNPAGKILRRELRKRIDRNYNVAN